MSRRVHFSTTNTNHGSAVCGEGRDPRQRVTLEVRDVTCRRCKMTAAFDTAWDVIEDLELATASKVSDLLGTLQEAIKPRTTLAMRESKGGANG